MSTSYQRLGDEPEVDTDVEKHREDKQNITVTQRPASDEYDGPHLERTSTNYHRPWHPDTKARFPKLGAASIILYLICCGILIFILIYSRGKDYDTFCLIRYGGENITIAGSQYKIPGSNRFRFNIPVSVWISTFMFFMGKLLALAFLEAVTVYWWVEALKGKTLKNLNHDYEASKSISTIVMNLRLFSWLCFCSIVFTLFGTAGPILQKSSTYAASNTLWAPSGPIEHGSMDFVPQHKSSLEATFLTKFDPNASAVTDARGDFLNYMPQTRFVKESFARNSDVLMQVDGCRHADPFRPVSECIGWFETAGFGYDQCSEEEIKYDDSPGATNEVFGVHFDYPRRGAGDPWSLNMTIKYKTSEGCGGNDTIIIRRCRMKPSLVIIPVIFHMLFIDKQEDYISFFSASAWGNFSVNNKKGEGSTINSYARARLQPVDDPFEGHDTILGDANFIANAGGIISSQGFVRHNYTLQILKPNDATELDAELPLPEDAGPYFVDLPTNRSIHLEGDPARTILGLAKMFNDTISSSFVIKEPEGRQSQRSLISSGGMMYVLGNKDRDQEIGSTSKENPERFQLCSLYFDDPTQQVLNYVRELMFRYAAMLPQIATKIADDFKTDTLHDNHASRLRSFNSKENYDLLDRYSATRSAYALDYKLMAIGIAIMVLCCICTCSLFWGFWKLGREVSLSPLEMGRALALHAQDAQRLAVAPGEASNVRVAELIDVLGDVKVKYGEVAPGRLGLGLYDDVNEPEAGRHYK